MSELYELPNGWEWKTLEYVCEKNSSNISLKMIENDEGIYPIYGAKGLIKTISSYRREESYIAIIKDGAGVGRVMICDEKSSIIATMQYLIPKNNVNIKFLFYFLSIVNFNEYVNGATIPHIYYKDYKNNPFPLPPLSEQQRIVAKLDKLFEKIDKSIALHQKNMDEADVFMGSVLNDVFGELEENYGLQSLSTVVKINSGIALPSIFKDKETTDGEYEFFKVAQMNNDDRVMKGADLNFTKEESINHKIKLFPKGSILIPKRGGAILTNKKRILEREASYDSNVMGLKADNKILSDEFLFVFLNSIDLSDYIDTSTIPQINNKHIDMMNISIPPLQIQQKVVKYLDEISEKIEKVKSVQKEKMDSLKALKASILDRAFKGEL